MRTAYDFSPLCRSVIGVDHVAERAEAAMKNDADRGHPPYDIEKVGDDAYRITLATAGFSPQDLEIVAQPNLLIITGHVPEGQNRRHYLHHGISSRDFERRFELADFVVVKSAACVDGLLTIDLAREVPDALKPRSIEIGHRASSRGDGVRDGRRAA
jgi:molecular chaperone IbpA